MSAFDSVALFCHSAVCETPLPSLLECAEARAAVSETYDAPSKRAGPMKNVPKAVSVARSEEMKVMSVARNRLAMVGLKQTFGYDPRFVPLLDKQTPAVPRRFGSRKAG